MPLWLPLALSAAVAGIASGSVTPVALLGIVLLAASLCIAMRAAAPRWQRIAFSATGVLLALALAMHRWPGFTNPVLIDAVRLSALSLPFTLYANLDKGAAGLLLLALCCRRAPSMPELFAALRRTWWLIVPGIVVIMTAAVMLGLIQPDFKWPIQAWIFLPVNLLFTVVAEEAFFRGVVQEAAYRSLGARRNTAITAIVLSAILFSVAHAGGGVRYMLLATLAGFLYALVYHRSRRIETAIAAHFLLNAVHFVGFTYPAMR